MNARAPAAKSSAGFTLIEMMIAMTLGLLLVIVIGNVFIASKETYTTMDELGRLQENARFTMSRVGSVVRMAGFVSNPADYSARGTIFDAVTAPALFGTEGASGANDSLTVRFQGSGDPADGTVLDCQGRRIKALDLSVNKFYIKTGTGTSLRSLWCDTTGSTVAGADVELIPNVDAMQVLFGEDTDVTADQVPNRYIPIDPAGTPPDMAKVVAVRIAFVFQSNDRVASDVDAKTYTVLNESYGPKSDRRMRRVFTTTIGLRNRLP
jgi:type IV pilus assembly protein PilW